MKSSGSDETKPPRKLPLAPSGTPFHRTYSRLKHVFHTFCYTRRCWRLSMSPRPIFLIIVVLICSVCILFRQFDLILLALPDNAVLSRLTKNSYPLSNLPLDPARSALLARRFDERNHSSESDIWRRTNTNCPPETNIPDPALYGKGTEKCFAIGLPDGPLKKPERGDPAAFWQMNSRALCYTSQPTCLANRQLKEFLSFETRGSGSCYVLSVGDKQIHDARNTGLNESCAAFRTRYISSMFGTEVFQSYKEWYGVMSAKEKTKSISTEISWRSNFAIVIPKYPWSSNICHFSRLWNFIIWVIRNLRLFEPEWRSIKHVDILFRTSSKYTLLWHKGMQTATIGAVQKETGIRITVRKLRYNSNIKHQCIRKAIWLGKEGRIDAFPFFNDSDVWLPRHQLNDSHWPVIPHDSLWLRQVIYKANGLPDIGRFSGPNIGTFHSIHLPPRRIAIIQRASYSRRRLTRSGEVWLISTLQQLSQRYGMEFVRVRMTSATPFKEQVSIMSQVGFSVGLHGANLVNTIFQPAGGALFEIFPWKYVRFYYAAGSNSGLRYSYHEPLAGINRNCRYGTVACAFLYRESRIFLTDLDRWRIQLRLEKAVEYLDNLYHHYPDGMIPLRRNGSLYFFGNQSD